MKKLLLLLSVFSLIIITSCGDDDESSPTLGLTGTLNFDGQAYSIANGIFSLTQDDGDAIGTFFLTDGTIASNGNGGATGTNSEILIFVGAIANGESALAEGSYATSTDTQALNANVSVTLSSDPTNPRIAFTNGTVVISGSGNTYSLTFDVPFGQGVTLTGTVTGTYANE